MSCCDETLCDVERGGGIRENKKEMKSRDRLVLSLLRPPQTLLIPGSRSCQSS